MTFTGHVYATVVIPSGVQVTVTNNGGGPTAVTWTAGTYESPAAAITALIAALEAARPGVVPWTITLSTTTGLVTIDCPSDTWALTWTSTDARDFLGFAGNIASTTSASTGTKNCLGLWIPDRPLSTRGNYLGLPDATDARATESPTGVRIVHVGNNKYEHFDLRWQTVEKHRVWVAHESTTNQSLQRFLRDTQWGQGHAWFNPGSKCMIIAHDGNELGNAGVAGWYPDIPGKMDEIVSRAVDGLDLLWHVTWPRVVSETS